MDEILPIIVFIAIVVVGNALDKKKPPATPLPQTFPIPPRMPEPPAPQHRPHHPDEYAQVHNPYQEYLTRHVKEQVPEAEQEESPYAQVEHKRGLSPIAQAIVWSEILGKPKSFRNWNKK